MSLGKLLTIEGSIEGEEGAADAQKSPLNDLYKMMRMLQDVIKACDLTILNVSYHQFQPYGLTVLYLLSESHVSIHTWPELNRFAIDVYSCRDDYEVAPILEIIRAALPELQKLTHRTLLRECN